MILKCIDGPMDGAVYAISRETSDSQQRSTNRKPDGLWFDATDEHGRHVQHQYAGGNAMPLVECKEPVVLEYRYTGPVVDTGLTLETEEHVVGTREREPEIAASESPAMQTLEEANQFYNGYLSGATAYAAAVGHSTLKSDNPKLCEVFDTQRRRIAEGREQPEGMSIAGPPPTTEHVAEWEAMKNRAEERTMKALREARLASVIDLPVFHQAEVNKWLSANGKTAAQVQHSIFPIGMVQRWIERAEQAEEKLQDEVYLRGNQLAAISTILMADTPVTLAATRLPKDHALYTAAFQDAVRAVEKIIRLRAKLAGSGTSPQTRSIHDENMLTCPACLDQRTSVNDFGEYRQGVCLFCGMRGPKAKTNADAREKWNKLPRIPHGDSAGEDEVGSDDPAGKPFHDWCANDMCPICNQRHAEELLKP